MIVVIAAVIERAGQYLVCQRPPHKRHGGLWEFPGGKVEAGETLLQAAQRELREELALTVIGIGSILLQAQDPGSEFTIQFMDVQTEGEPVPLEHTALRWLSREELITFPLAPCDQLFAQQFIKGIVEEQVTIDQQCSG